MPVTKQSGLSPTLVTLVYKETQWTPHVCGLQSDPKPVMEDLLVIYDVLHVCIGPDTVVNT